MDRKSGDFLSTFKYYALVAGVVVAQQLAI